jgi:hypothetical protein
MLANLCEATNFNNFSHTAALTEQIYKALESSQPANFHDLLKTKKPSDSRPRAYEWGYRATDEARSALGIAHNDPNGYLAFFEKMELDPDKGAEKSTESLNTQFVSGAVSRTDDNTRVALVGTNVAQRKFSAARAAFLAWSTEKISSRLVTTARTRDQQASRAFAAELLAPAKYLKKRLGDRNEISSFQLDKLSEEMGIASTVVHYQAKNNGYFISEAA